MVSPGDLTAGFEGLGAAAMPNMMYWVGIGLVSFFILGIIVFVMISFQYNVGIYKLELGEMGDRNSKRYFIKGIKFVRAKLERNKGIERISFFMSKLKTEPIGDQYMFNFNGFFVRKVSFVYALGREIYIPTKLDFAISSNPGAYVSFNPLPFDVKRAVSLELQEIARDYEDPGFMAKYGGVLLTLGTVVFCLVMVGLTIYMTYKYIGGELGRVADVTGGLAESLKNVGQQKFGGS